MASAGPDSPDSPATTQWRKASKFYRRPPGLTWLIGLAIIPLLLGVIGYGMLDRSRLPAGGEAGPGGALPTLIEPTMPAAPPPGLALAPLSIVRHGAEITLNGNLPSPAAKRVLLDSVIASMGEGVNIIDNLGVNPNLKALDFSSAAPVFEAGATIPDFSLTVNGDTVTLSGTAATAEASDAVEDAAEDAWPYVNIVNKLEIKSLVSPTAPNAPSYAPLSIFRNGNVVTVNGDLPDADTRASLLSMLVSLYGQGTQIVDNLNIKPGLTAPDLASLSAVFKAAGAMPDFKFKISGDTVTLNGTAASDGQLDAVGTAAEKAWPNLNIVNDIAVRPSAPSPAPSSSSAPGAASCGNLQADITGLLRAPISFATDGYTLSPDSTPQLAQVADKVKACANANVAVNGYTDNTGNDAINGPLSTRRAKSVADFLVAHGVPADHVTAKGFGSADPIASNDTPDGRMQNRRVTIVVS